MRWQTVERVVREAAAPGGVAPAVSLLVGSGREVLFEDHAGLTGAPGRETPADASTIFDLASLTKPLATVAVALALVRRGLLSLDSRVVDFVPRFAGGGAADGAVGTAITAGAASGQAAGTTLPGPAGAEGVAPSDPRRATVTVRDLLRHDSGLPAYRRYFEDEAPARPASSAEAEARRSRMLDRVLCEPLERDPRSGSVYSDLGFLVLGAVLEAVGGARIDRLAQDLVFGPLGVDGVFYVDIAEGAPAGAAARIAATGACDWRGSTVHAEVQDENAWAMGGIASHAGLFASARTVHALVAEWTDAASGHGRVLDQALVAHAWNRAEAAHGAAASTWALGWDTPSPGASSAGRLVSPAAVGHLGYTGTSVWIDPVRRAHVVLLTNRIACGRTQDAIRAARPRVHDAVFAALDAP